jgi:hypothetical protein
MSQVVEELSPVYIVKLVLVLVMVNWLISLLILIKVGQRHENLTIQRDASSFPLDLAGLESVVLHL